MLGLGRAATVCLPLLVSVAVGILEEEWRGEVGAQVTPRLEHTMVGQWLLLSPVVLLVPWSPPVCLTCALYRRESLATQCP